MQFAVVGLVVIQMCTEQQVPLQQICQKNIHQNLLWNTRQDSPHSSRPSNISTSLFAKISNSCLFWGSYKELDILVNPPLHPCKSKLLHREFLQCLQVNMFSPAHLFILCHHSPWCSLNMSVLVFTVNRFTNCMCDVQLGIHFVRNRDQL